MLLDFACACHDLVHRFDRARSGNDDEVVAAESCILHFDDGILRLVLTTREPIPRCFPFVVNGFEHRFRSAFRLAISWEGDAIPLRRRCGQVLRRVAAQDFDEARAPSHFVQALLNFVET